MSLEYAIQPEINLHVHGRISQMDADRQRRTAAEILRRFTNQPGVILADEVGMGKTFVALSVAVSVALQNRGKHPVVVMVPPSLKEKWPSDFDVFRSKCVPTELQARLRYSTADCAEDFLKLLDDPLDRRSSIIFLTHGAMSRGLQDPWVMLALIQRSTYRRQGAQEFRHRLTKFLGELLQRVSLENRMPDIWERLLETKPHEWRGILSKVTDMDDDPVPGAIIDAMEALDTDEIYRALQELPKRESKNYRDYVVAVRRDLKRILRDVWNVCLEKLKLRLPLLILDEAHHLKNADTDLASLFRCKDSAADADELKGRLAGVFDRMLFLTATPFQLGHNELCSILDRFEGISWSGVSAPTSSREEFAEQRQALREALDRAQESAVSLDVAWGKLRQEDLVIAERVFAGVDDWWPAARVATSGLTAVATDVMVRYQQTKERMSQAQQQLQPWVIRHLKPRVLLGTTSDIARRRRCIGKSILPDCEPSEADGLSVNGSALLPFLLAARASSHAPKSRPVFAEGLASSFEAFLHTRKAALSNDTAAPASKVVGDDPSAGAATSHATAVMDDDDDANQLDVQSTNIDAAHWYLSKLDELLPKNAETRTSHPKVDATVQRVAQLWKSGEKVVVFCHYIATGRILRQRISQRIHEEICQLGAQKLGCPISEVPAELDRIGNRFFDTDSPTRQACDQLAQQLLDEFPALSDHHATLTEIIRRNLRTPSLLVRFFPLHESRLDESAVAEAFESKDFSGLTLRRILHQFLRFLQDRCGPKERQRYIDAVRRIQTGAHFGIDVGKEYDDDELQDAQPEHLLPNVRLVNGTTRSETRQRLMLTFNTPFYPEILIASSVMAEGVDLHLNCRYILHHDLCWNPSTLEQRTGRVDRIGAKAEQAEQPILVYLPFIAETQDEKMYRVVMDRERWFNVVMGEDYKVDARTTEKLAERIPFPEAAANELAFQLGIETPRNAAAEY